MSYPNLPSTMAVVQSGTRDASVPINGYFSLAFAFAGGAQSATTSTPPAAPADGQVYLLPPSPAPTGVWQGQGGKIAVWSAAAVGYTYVPGFRGHLWRVLDSSLVVEWNGSAWTSITNPSGAIGAVAQDHNPQLGGPLDGNNQTVGGVRPLCRTLTSSDTSVTFDFHYAKYFYTGTGACTISLPSSAAQSSLFSATVDLDPGSLVFQPAAGASLSSGSLGVNIASARTISANRATILEVKKNTSGSGAAWIVYGDHQA